MTIINTKFFCFIHFMAIFIITLKKYIHYFNTVFQIWIVYSDFICELSFVINLYLDLYCVVLIFYFQTRIWSASFQDICNIINNCLSNFSEHFLIINWRLNKTSNQSTWCSFSLLQCFVVFLFDRKKNLFI